MPRKSSSDLTLAKIRRELEEHDNKPLLVGASLVVGAVMVVGGVATAGVAALGLLAGKDEAFKVADSLMAKSRKRRKEGPEDRHRRMLIAHQLMVYSSFFEAATDVLEAIKRHAPPEIEEGRFSSLALAWMADKSAASRKDTMLKEQLVVAAPHPADSLEDYDVGLYAFYSRLAARWADLLAALPAQEADAAEDLAHAQAVLLTLAADAVDHYNARYCMLVAENPEFKAWVHLRNSEQVARSLARLPEDVAERLKAEAFGQQLLDVGLAELRDQLDDLAATPRRRHANEVAGELARRYEAAAEKPILDADEQETNAPQLSYPSRREAFIPQAFKVLRTTAGSATGVRLSDDAVWADAPAREDLSLFLLAYLQSAYSAQAPLIVMGLPGAGKSLLSEMIAAHTAAKHFTSIRVPLRNADPSLAIYKQLEQQIEADTLGQRVTWPDFSKEVADRPPLAIFDGYDELLQAQGDHHTSFIEYVQRFQGAEADMGRELRAIVTSRPTLIDKARVPAGCTVIRLLDFDERRIREWIEIWNDHNAVYFEQPGKRRFAVPARSDIQDLASQPLLLFLLALFDAEGDGLRDEAGVSRADLYNALLVSFLKRQRRKEGGTRNPPQTGRIANDMGRLGIAAMSMFNRATLHVRSEQLERDLAFFASEEAPQNADELFGKFFFVHVSRSRAGRDDAGRPGQAAYEFVHNTFGEFLTADFILRALVEEIGMQIATDARQPAYAELLEETSRPDEWCARLMYTPLYARPVVLEMMRSWLPHLLVEHGIAADVFIAQLDTFIGVQLQRIVGATAPPASLARNPAPYAPLPFSTHYAIYTLNLVLLRVAIDGTPLVVDDGDPSEGRTPKWEQLSSLWRGRVSESHLATIAGFVQVRREDGRALVLRRDSPIGRPSAARLETAWRAASVLGDRLTAGALAAHLHDVGDRQPVALLEIGQDLRAEAVDLDLDLEMRGVRSDGWPRDTARIALLEQHARKAVRLQRTSPTHRELLVLLTAVDAPIHLRSEGRRALPNPRSVDALWSSPDAFADAHIRFCASVAPRWAADFVAETLQREGQVGLAQSAPVTFAACVDVASPLDGSGGVVDGIQDAWLVPVTAGLLKHDLEPVVLIALLDLAMRLDTPELVAECRQRLVRENARRSVREISTARLRRLVKLAEGPPDDGLAQWLLSGVELAERSLPADVLLDVHRLRIAGGERTHIDRATVERWPLSRNDADVAALARLLAELDRGGPGDAGSRR